MLEQVRADMVGGKTVRKAERCEGAVMVSFEDGTFLFLVAEREGDAAVVSDTATLGEHPDFRWMASKVGAMTRDECRAAEEAERAERAASEKAEYERLRAKFAKESP